MPYRITARTVIVLAVLRYGEDQYGTEYETEWVSTVRVPSRLGRNHVRGAAHPGTGPASPRAPTAPSGSPILGPGTGTPDSTALAYE